MVKPLLSMKSAWKSIWNEKMNNIHLLCNISFWFFKIQMACKKFKSIALLQYCNIYFTFLNTKILQYCKTDFDYWLKVWPKVVLIQWHNHDVSLQILIFLFVGSAGLNFANFGLSFWHNIGTSYVKKWWSFKEYRRYFYL